MNNLDIFKLDTQLSSEEILIRDTAKKLNDRVSRIQSFSLPGQLDLPQNKTERI